MSKQFRRLLSLLLALALLIGLIPASASANGLESPRGARVYTEEENALLDEDVFAKISAIEVEESRAMGGINVMTEADYIALIPQVIQAIESSETYVPGSLQQNGYFLVWQTTTGIPCCFDPRMEAELHNTTNVPTQAEIEAVEADAELMATRLEEMFRTNTHTPTSVEIGLIQPYWESSSNYADSTMNTYSPYYKSMWQALYRATGGGSNYRYAMANATIDNIARTIENCGLVIFDSHGTTDYSGGNDDYTSRANTSYLCLTTNSGITTADTTARTGPYGTYYNAMRGSGYAYVNGDCIANHMTRNAPNSLVYMGICLGMATDGMCSGLRRRGVETVYGYSQSVTFRGERIYMEAILGYIKDGDDFGTAVTKAKNENGKWDPVYANMTEAQARANKAAFPITVSSEDAYPGHGRVDAVQTVHSTWQLFASNNTNYTVNAVSNNTRYGTVSVNGNTITANPASGYYAASYTVTQGSATVTQNGNTFTVTPSSNCTVQINFAAKTQYTVKFMANGSQISSSTVYSGDSLTLPSTATAISGWTFLGWSSSQVSNTSTKPSYFAPGATVTVSGNATLYALYTRVEGNGGGSNVYELLTSAPSDWSGNYVITYGTTSSNMYVLKGLSGNGSYESSSAGGAVALSSTGMSLSGSKLSNVGNAYVFNVASSNGKYSIRNASTGTYLGSRSNYLYSDASFSSSYDLWSLSLSNSRVTATNAASSRYPYLAFSSFKYFMISSSSSSTIYFWKQTQGGTSYYSTSPSGTTPTPDPVTTYTVSFSVPSGVASVASISCNAGNSITLPTAGAPSGYTFLGWVTSAVNNSQTAPSTILKGSYKPTGNITLRALYSYSTSSGGSSYQLMTSAPTDWSGSYVITYGNTSGSMYVLKGLSGNGSYESTSAGGAVALSSTGMSLSGSKLTNVSNAYVFNIASYSGKYTIRNASTGTYLANRSNYLYSDASFNASYDCWSLAMSGSAVKASNTASSRYPYLSFYSSSRYFMVSGSAYASIYFWKLTSGGTASYYTTQIP